MRSNPHLETADLVTLTEEIHYGKLHFLCSVLTELLVKDLPDILSRQIEFRIKYCLLQIGIGCGIFKKCLLQIFSFD